MNLIKVNKFYLAITVVTIIISTCLKSFSTGNTLFIQSILLGLFIVYIYSKNDKDVDFKKDVLHFNKVTKKTLLKSLISVIGLFPIVITINMLLVYFVVVQYKTNTSLNASPLTPGNPENIIVLLFTMGIVPAVIEELIFRGIILSNLSKYGNKFAIIYSSILYSLIHYNPVTILTDFLLGIIYGNISLKTKSTIPSIIAHCICNCLTILMIYSKMHNGIFLVCIVLFAVWLVYYLMRFCIYISKKYSGKFNFRNTLEVKRVEENCKHIVEEIIQKTKLTTKDIVSMIVVIVPMSCIGYVMVLLKLI